MSCLCCIRVRVAARRRMLRSLMPAERAVAIDRRLEELTVAASGLDAENRRRRSRSKGFVKRVGEKVPRSTKELGNLRLRLFQAGYRR